MPSPQKIKGSGWENEAAKYLSALYEEHFCRVPSSGAYVGGKNSVRKNVLHTGQIRGFKGDIIPGQSFPKLNIEAKFYAGFPFHQLFQGEVKILELWISQCLEAADEGDFNILLMKFNRIGKWVCVEAKHPLVFEKHFTYSSAKYGDWVLMDYENFWTRNSSTVKILCK